MIGKQQKSAGAKVAEQIKKFFYETFKRHGGDDYSEFLNRGLKGREKGLHRIYPWMYVRIFALLFILFAVFLLIIRFTENELFSPTVMMLSSFVFNLSFLVLLYELYPKNDLSFIAVVGVMLIAGAASDVITQVLYSLFKAPDVWLSAVYAGFFEELAKGAATVFAIVVVRNRNPVAGFVIGAAVGCGFSIVEDMGYIFLTANEMPVINMSVIITQFFSRGMSSFCTHMLWTGAVGWAYSFFNRHFSNACFYLVLILSCGLHICWDLPLQGFLYYLVIVVCVIAAAAECIAMVYGSCKRTVKELTADFNDVTREQLEIDHLLKTGNGKRGKSAEYFSHAGNLSIVVCAFIMAVFSIIYCSIPFRESFYAQSFETAESFVSFMQEDYELHVDKMRVFDKRLPEENNSTVAVDGVISRVTQKVDEDGFTYFYTYNVVEIENKNYYYFMEVSVELERNGVYSRYFAEDIYNDGKLFASFFRVRGDVTGYNFGSDGKISAFVHNAAFERDLSQPQYTVLFYTFAGVAGVAFVLFVAFKLKARSVKKKDEK